LSETVRAFLPWVGISGKGAGQTSEKKADFKIVADMVRPGTRVLDLGCGDGALLTLLAEKRKIRGLGVDIDLHNVAEVIDKGHDVFQEDIDTGLAMIPDGSYDYAILSETLQVVQKPRVVLREVLRVAKEGIVSFSNQGKWSHRLHIGFLGQMPKVGVESCEWYDTPSIHLFTLRDFIELCRQDDIKILEIVCIPEGWLSNILVGIGFCNLGADRVLARITRGSTFERH